MRSGQKARRLYEITARLHIGRRAYPTKLRGRAPRPSVERHTDANPDAGTAVIPAAHIGAAAIPRVVKTAAGVPVGIAVVQVGDLTVVGVGFATDEQGQQCGEADQAKGFGFHFLASPADLAGMLTKPMAPPSGSVMIATCIAPGSSCGATSTCAPSALAFSTAAGTWATRTYPSQPPRVPLPAGNGVRPA